MDQLPSEVFQLISKYLTEEDLSNLSRVTKTTRKHTLTIKNKIENFIREKLETYNIDDLIFGIANGSIEVDDPNHVIQASQVLDYLLKRKKYSNQNYVNIFVKNLIRYRYSKEIILSRILSAFGLIPATRYIEGFNDEETKKDLVKKLGYLYNKQSLKMRN
jgi:hypothetical protein